MPRLRTKLLRWFFCVGLSNGIACQTAVVQTKPATSTSEPFRLNACTEPPLRLDGMPTEPQSRGCVGTFTQPLTDRSTRERLKVEQLQRRYLVYAPPNLSSTPAPVVFVFPGSSANAEAAAFYYTHTRFEELADREGFIVVYGNGVPEAHNSDGQVPMPKKGASCLLVGCNTRRKASM